MSDAVSALSGAKFVGAVTVTDAGLRGMITLRGDMDDAGLAHAVKSAIGLAQPMQREIKHGKKGSVAWMSPDELLLLMPYDQADAMVEELTAALSGQHALAFNISDARAVFTIAGQGAREVLAKGAPTDLSSAGFKQGEIRRTRLGQVAVAFWISGKDEIELVCFRSVAGYVFDFLSTSGAPDSLPEFLT